MLMDCGIDPLIVVLFEEVGAGAGAGVCFDHPDVEEVDVGKQAISPSTKSRLLIYKLTTIILLRPALPFLITVNECIINLAFFEFDVKIIPIFRRRLVSNLASHYHKKGNLLYTL